MLWPVTTNNNLLVEYMHKTTCNNIPPFDVWGGEEGPNNSDVVGMKMIVSLF